MHFQNGQERRDLKFTTAPMCVCEHIKEAGLLDMQGYDDSDGRSDLSVKYKIPWGGFAIMQRDWNFINEIIEKENVKTVLEFGAGISSLIMSEKCKVVTYETKDEAIEELSKKINGNDLEIRKWDGKKVFENERFDLAFVDGPLGTLNGGIGRRASIESASHCSDRVIVHDSNRGEEKSLQRQYLMQNGFEFVKNNGYHQSSCAYWKHK